jgi:Putative Ig domain/RTX calcium-binding nonapeptide repeat (4 copies)
VLDIRVTATDPGLLSVSDIFRLTVTPSNDVPVLSTPIPNRTFLQDAAFTLSITSSFRDPDGTALAYSAIQVNGNALPSWLKFANGVFSGAPPIEASPLNVTVTARDASASIKDGFVLAFSAPPLALFTLANDGNNTILGSLANDRGRLGGGNDVFDGRAGNDTALGGLGNDKLTGGLGNDALYGQAGLDIVVGNEGDDLLSGGLNADVLTGGLGRDTFLFNTRDGSFDTITDFRSVDDVIQLDNYIFIGLASAGPILGTAFRIVSLALDSAISAATDTDDRLIYNKLTGSLFYDADGRGGATGMKIAVLEKGLALISADFLVI